MFAKSVLIMALSGVQPAAKIVAIVAPRQKTVLKLAHALLIINCSSSSICCVQMKSDACLIEH